MEPKFLGKSKTWWFNIASIGLAVLQSQDVVALMPQQVLFYVNAVGNIVLRLFTSSPITVKTNGKTTPQ